MPPRVGPWARDLPWWLAGLFLVLLLYRASPKVGGVLLVVLALGALVVLAQRGGI